MDFTGAEYSEWTIEIAQLTIHQMFDIIYFDILTFILTEYLRLGNL
jgi:hypothetical protein